MKIKIPNYKQACVLVIGDIMLDRYWHGSVNKISPEAPVPIASITKSEDKPGGAANVAMNIASLGAYSHLIGLTGIDNTSKILTKILNYSNVRCDFITSPIHKTIKKIRILSQNQQLIRLDFENDFKNINQKNIIKRIKQILPNINTIVISDYSKGTLTKIEKTINLANEAGIPIIIDPKKNNFECYKYATLLTPNLHEFESIVGPCKNNDEIEKKGKNLIQKLKLTALLITRSEQGMSLICKNKMPLHLKTQAKKVFDVTGAGDTVIGVLAASIASGCSLHESCILANISAGIVVKKFGASTVSLTELKKSIYKYSKNDFGIISEKKLKKVVFYAKMRGERIVMTNGCFDILHTGHISYLKNARKLGDRLIVAVNSDSSIRRLKGINRPINKIKQRMNILNALNSIDWIVSFDDDTPKRLIISILPDILVKGGDYNIKEIEGSKEVLAAGGQVKILKFIDGFSTTNTINNIIKLKNN
ncbi:bifunctional D-glycero-beta-D-manno-heptose-7-phosphate kinase/D-glycero-beta-D-manno-heptose 1-phosphate adenylyltransferase HldE [Candidatus Providencia siddallii]|uniref:Bifunctional protein HldE n=1 Tax=Candidatus Providencia siddallii TaxID=1715285 RepID=A0ABM9NND1_9GAMM